MAKPALNPQARIQLRLFLRHVDYASLKHIHCPRCSMNGRITRMVAHLNDEHKWTFNDIAHWLETAEHNIELI